MRPPSDLPSTLVALGEAFARRAGIAPADFWAYVYRKKAPPAALRAAIVEALFPAVSPADFLPLPARGENDTLGTMDASTLEAPRRGRPYSRPHPLFVALAKEHMTVRELAEALNRSQSAVKSWCKDKGDPAFRPIPRACVEYLSKNLGVPASAWARVRD
jgi:hypothetical protein